MDFVIRPAVPRDLPAINAIYNHYVTRSTCTYQEIPATAAERRKWFARHGAGHPVIVAEFEGVVIGWASLSAFHLRQAYRFTVEDSVYVHQEHHRKGVGKALLKELFARARGLGYRSVIAIISADQGASIALHARFGFSEVGVLKKVGFKFDRWLDVIYMQRLMARPR
jgi:phosphinothricin acetyltransferase